MHLLSMLADVGCAVLAYRKARFSFGILFLLQEIAFLFQNCVSFSEYRVCFRMSVVTVCHRSVSVRATGNSLFEHAKFPPPPKKKIPKIPVR